MYTHCTNILSLESVYTQSTDILILGIVYTHCTNILSLESVYTQPSDIWSFGIVYTHCCTRKLSMRINHKHFVYIISLPELAWKKCKQTGLWFILVDTFWLYWFFIILSMMESTQIWPAVLSTTNTPLFGSIRSSGSHSVRVSVCLSVCLSVWDKVL